MSFQPGYIGSKAGAGVFHRVIGEMPPHSVYLEAFLGGGAIFHHKKPAQSSILIDRDPEVIAKVGATCLGVIARCGDALEIVPTLALPADAVAYFDPPYPLSTRKGRSYYKFEMTDADHERLLAMVLKLPYRVLISSYPNKLYIDALREWRCCRFAAMTHGGKREEMLWCNFPEPVELHDWRFAGRTYRERQSLTKLRKRWVRKYRAMPAWKQNFLLAALTSTSGKGGALGRSVAPGMALRDPRAEKGAARSTEPLCLCGCGAVVPVGRTMATAACRKRKQRARERHALLEKALSADPATTPARDNVTPSQISLL